MTTPPVLSNRAALTLLVVVTVAVLAIGPLLASATASAKGAEPATSTSSTVAVDDTRIEPATAGRAVPFTSSTTTTTAPPPQPGEVHVCPAPTSEFVDSWGFARSGGRRHQGVDMMTAYGDPILAPTDGVVRRSNSRLGGLGFYLDGFDGTTYFGSHLATLDHEGLVTAGTQIGTSGSSGNASSPHLHFEVHPGGGGAVNPFPFVHEWCQVPDWDDGEPLVVLDPQRF